MSAISQLLSVARIYGDATNTKGVTLSWRLFGDSKKLERLEQGFDIQVTRYEKAMQWLSDRWPSGADWPCDVPRPPQSPEALASDPEPVDAVAALPELSPEPVCRRNNGLASAGPAR